MSERVTNKSLAFPTNFAQHLTDAPILMQHLTDRQHWFVAGKLSFRHAVIKNNIHGGAEVQAVISRYVHELVTVAANNWRHAAVLRTENVHGLAG